MKRKSDILYSVKNTIDQLNWILFIYLFFKCAPYLKVTAVKGRFSFLLILSISIA